MKTRTQSPEEVTALAQRLHRLARNLWWTWNQESQEIFQQLSPRSWQNLYHNAVAVLHEVSDYELRIRLQEPGFAARVREAIRAFDTYVSDKNTWARKHAPQLQAGPVAYFTAEIGFHETLPIAAGGLGIQAGDHARSASDMGLGFVGISLFYREGYSIEKSLGGGLKNLSPEQRAALEDMTTAMINKLLHAPIAQLKRRGDDDDDETGLYIAALKKLFDLEEK